MSSPSKVSGDSTLIKILVLAGAAPWNSGWVVLIFSPSILGLKRVTWASGDFSSGPPSGAVLKPLLPEASGDWVIGGGGLVVVLVSGALVPEVKSKDSPSVMVGTGWSF